MSFLLFQFSKTRDRLSLTSKGRVLILKFGVIVRLVRSAITCPFLRVQLSLILAIFVLATPDLSVAQTSTDETDTEPVFVAPEVGIPADRLGAGTRSIVEDLDGPLYLLVPPDGGYTSMAKPPLVWRIKSGFRGVVSAQITTVGDEGIVIERNGAFAPGFYALDLRRTDFDLAVGQTYRLSVRLVSQGTTVARESALVQRISPAQVDPGREGLWFDFLAPLVSVDLSGRVRVTDTEAFDRLVDAGEIKQ